MGLITDEDIQRIRDATDLVELISERVVLQRKGRLYWGKCPFHGEKTPSFKVDPSTQLWHCFGCGLGGDAFGFTMRSENLEFPEAARALADRAHIEILEVGGACGGGKRERLHAACAAAAAHYHRMLIAGSNAGAARAREYLAGRGFGIEVAKRFELGYSAGGESLARALQADGFNADEIVQANLATRSAQGALRDRFFERVMFPIRDVQGRCVGFGGRILGEGQPKYLNTQETPIFHKSRNMYGIDRARNHIVQNRGAIVVEGYTDVIALHEAGVENAVATLGTALTREHMRLLGRFAQRIVYLFDGDEAGLRAADRATEFIGFVSTPEAGASRTDLAVAIIPEQMDPADYVAGHGAAGIVSLVDGAVPLIRFALDRRLAEFNLSIPENRVRALASAASLLTAVKGSLLAHDYINYVADRLFVDFATVQAAVARAKPISVTEEQARGTGESPQPSAERAVVSPQSRAEQETLALLADHPRLRAEAQYLLSDDLLTVSLHREALRLFLDDPDSPRENLVLRAEQQQSGLASVFAGGQAVEEEAAAERLFKELLRKLQEFRLDRQILEKKSQLKTLDPASRSREYDELFREVSELQRERNDLRSAPGEVEDTE